MKSATIKSWKYEAVPGMIYMSRWTKLTHLDISGTQFTVMPVFPNTLTHLDAWKVVIASDEEGFFVLPKLEYLNVTDSRLFTAVNDIANPALASGSLKELHVGSNATAVGTDRRNSWLESLPLPSLKLKALSLNAQTELPEKTMIALLRQYPNLKKVDLSYTGATGSTLRELFERENKPDFIDMQGCEGCHYDAVEAARKAGIQVVHELAPKYKAYKGRPHSEAWPDITYLWGLRTGI